jgi:hypothetical protein
LRQREFNQHSRWAAARLLGHHTGDQADPLTWLPVLREIGCRVHPFHDPGGQKGDYAPTLDSDGTGIVQYNTAYSPPFQARVLVHEGAHHLLWPIITGFLYGEWVRANYDDDPLDVRQRIARRVEEIIFAGKSKSARVVPVPEE